jgi:hypothetical protein
MTRHMGLALAGLVVLAACSEPDQKTPMGPELKVTPPPTACNFDAVKTLINSYFRPPDQQTAQAFLTAMQPTSQSAAAVDNGYAILNMIGKTSRASAPPSPLVGSNLTKAVIKCMFDASSIEYTSLVNGSGLDAVRFDSALSAATGGVYYVVGAGYDSPDVPKSLKGSVDSLLSAVAPGNSNDPASRGTWTAALQGDTVNHQGGRTLVFGYPVTTNPIVYEWATIAPNTTFSPFAIVSVCDGQTDPNLMLHESSLGVLAFTTVNLCGLPDASGTTKSGFRSHFKSTPVSTVTLKFSPAPPSGTTVGVQFSATVRATTPVEGTSTAQGVNGACLYMTGTNNNGQGTALSGTRQCGGTDGNGAGLPTNVLSALTDTKDGQAGYAAFGITVSKTGGLSLTVSLKQVVLRTGQSAANITAKTNVRPAN